jgi:hypothetical protein
MRVVALFILAICAGCAPVVSIEKAGDDAAGYRSSVAIGAHLHHNAIKSETVRYSARHLEARKHLRNVPLDGSVNAQVALEGSEKLTPKTEVRVHYDMDFWYWLTENLGRVSAQTTFEIGPYARLNIASVPACLHVGDVTTINYKLQPQPRTDRFRLAVNVVSGPRCIEGISSTKHSRAGLLMRATCEGSIAFKVIAPERPLLKSSPALQTKVVPTIAPPAALAVEVGAYQDQDQVGQPSGQSRAVTLRWQARPDVLETALTIYSGNEPSPVEESLFQQGVNQYTAILATGKTYRWDIRAKYQGCVPEGEWSELSRGSSFVIPK